MAATAAVGNAICHFFVLRYDCEGRALRHTAIPVLSVSPTQWHAISIQATSAGTSCEPGLASRSLDAHSPPSLRSLDRRCLCSPFGLASLSPDEDAARSDYIITQAKQHTHTHERHSMRGTHNTPASGVDRTLVCCACTRTGRANRGIWHSVFFPLRVGWSSRAEWQAQEIDGGRSMRREGVVGQPQRRRRWARPVLGLIGPVWRRLFSAR